MKTSDFYYDLPERLIAQTPIEPRDMSRMMVIDGVTGEREDHIFHELPAFLKKGDALVLNETKVIPARLLGIKEETGVPVEVLLLRRQTATEWETLVRPGRRLKKGTRVSFGDGLLRCEIGDTTDAGGRIVRFEFEGVFEELLDRLGEMPLPPYIHEKLQDQSRYQTVYAKQEGSAAAPTAGLHFTPRVLDEIRAKGVEIIPVLLHVGLGTFRPVKAEDVEDHVMHTEYYEVTPEAAARINACRANGGRVVCVGTTSVRTLETVADENGIIHPGSGMTQIFITPGVKIKAVDALLTNFHLPESTLLMLISAFIGRHTALDAYADAVRKEYRFFSFGDCMFISRRKDHVTPED
ncbi:MAG: tRNA preQ1(34) S-adenosylmethionine ribosyltransferase-isomerase QueA [Clostridiales bacterium]|nr:tRNA preQ1(34) S-adenosylmethionine ribosyltransferase-isomerase QueA [Clostridiales bacterium]